MHCSQRRRYSNYAVDCIVYCVYYIVVRNVFSIPSFLPPFAFHPLFLRLYKLPPPFQKGVCVYTGARGGWGDTSKQFQKCQCQGHSSVTCLRGPSTDVSRHLSLSQKVTFDIHLFFLFFFSFFTCEHRPHLSSPLCIFFQNHSQ